MPSLAHQSRTRGVGGTGRLPGIIRRGLGAGKYRSGPWQCLDDDQADRAVRPKGETNQIRYAAWSVRIIQIIGNSPTKNMIVSTA